MKKVLLVAFLFLSACASDSQSGAGDDTPQKPAVISEEVSGRSLLLSQWYAAWIEQLNQVTWYSPGAESADLAEQFVLGVTLPLEFYQTGSSKLLLVLEAFQKMRDPRPESAEMLALAQKTLKE